MDYGSVKNGDRDASSLRPQQGRQRIESSSTFDSMYSDDTTVDEETSLLRGPQKVTPLPWLQISIILLLQVCEPLTSMSIYPYINQLVGGLDITEPGVGNEHQVGYYAGLIMSLFFVTEAITVLHWSRLSDHVGRKPILLIGLFGTAVSMLSFGLSRTFWSLVISRCLCGLLNGNIGVYHHRFTLVGTELTFAALVGVMKSVMGELTDPSNRAKGFALMPAVWATGATLGPLIGGTLAQPADRFPSIFGGKFWQDFPYFLPCLATSIFVFIAFGITLVYFKEVRHHVMMTSQWTNHKYKTVSKKTLASTLHASPSEVTLHHASDEPVPLRQLLVYPVLLSISNYINLAFLNIALDALLPLFLAMPLSAGGLGFSPASIGLIMGSYGAFTGIFQALFFPTFIRHCGVKRVFVTGMAAFLPIFALFPIISIDALKYGVNSFTWICIAIILGLMALMDMSFGCIFMYITASAPNKRSLGATNGLSQMTVSIARAVGPTLATSLFAVSVQHKILWGYGVYAILVALSFFAVLLALCLPKDVWEEAEDDY
ncbi:hypothetical protein H0H87_010935 [Tephrocybe sp. NHM501043]|nr:hypothetical protein H0H87_010935 [Tephrocybe sp. NHM501043]